MTYKVPDRDNGLIFRFFYGDNDPFPEPLLAVPPARVERLEVVVAEDCLWQIISCEGRTPTPRARPPPNLSIIDIRYA